MGRINFPIVAFNRGLVSPMALGRVDLDRTKLSAEVMTNWLPKTQGAMRIRPGTKYLGSSYNDSGAAWIEFVASTDDTALVELTDEKMRIWIDDALLGGFPSVGTTVSLSDTGWDDASTGGAASSGSGDVIPDMTAATTNGVTITASSQDVSADRAAWRAADDGYGSYWADTGEGQASTLPSWWKVDFGAGDTGLRRAVLSYKIAAQNSSAGIDNMPSRWTLITSNFDTGTYATDTGKWTLEDTQGSETLWAVSERRSYTLPGADTGTVEARRYWRLNFLEQNGTEELRISEIEMFDADSAQQVKLVGGQRVLNAGCSGSMARAA